MGILHAKLPPSSSVRRTYLCKHALPLVGDLHVVLLLQLLQLLLLLGAEGLLVLLQVLQQLHLMRAEIEWRGRVGLAALGGGTILPAEQTSLVMRSLVRAILQAYTISCVVKYNF